MLKVSMDNNYTVYVCDIYRDVWRYNQKEKWISATEVKEPLFCTGTPKTENKPFQPACISSWPIEVQFYDGSKYYNGTLKTCSVYLSEYNLQTTRCLEKVVNGFNDKTEKLDWLVYVTSGYNARILYYYDFAETLIKR